MNQRPFHSAASTDLSIIIPPSTRKGTLPIIKFRPNAGQTAALMAGIDHAAVAARLRRTEKRFLRVWGFTEKCLWSSFSRLSGQAYLRVRRIWHRARAPAVHIRRTSYSIGMFR
jgi:hypothetical protein